VDNSTQGILEVHEKIKGSPFKHLLQPHRKFLREEKFTTPGEGEKWFALFNDIILWTDEEYVYEGHYSLKDTKLKKIKTKPQINNTSSVWRIQVRKQFYKFIIRVDKY